MFVVKVSIHLEKTVLVDAPDEDEASLDGANKVMDDLADDYVNDGLLNPWITVKVSRLE